MATAPRPVWISVPAQKQGGASDTSVPPGTLVTSKLVVVKLPGRSSVALPTASSNVRPGAAVDRPGGCHAGEFDRVAGCKPADRAGETTLDAGDRPLCAGIKLDRFEMKELRTQAGDRSQRSGRSKFQRVSCAGTADNHAGKSKARV